MEKNRTNHPTEGGYEEPHHEHYTDIDTTAFNELTEVFTTSHPNEVQSVLDGMSPRLRKLTYDIVDHTMNKVTPAVKGRKLPAIAMAAARSAQMVTRGRKLSMDEAFGAHMAVSMHALHAVSAESDDTESPYDAEVAYYTTHHCLLLAWQIDRSELQGISPTEYAQTVTSQTPALAEKTAPQSWVQAKIDSFAFALETRKHIETIVGRETELKVDDYKKLRNNNTALAAELQRLKCYTIKPAVHIDGERSTSIHDTREVREMQKQQVDATGSPVPVHEWMKMVMVAIEHPTHEDPRETPLYKTEIAWSGEGPTMPNYDGKHRACFMDEKGGLYVDHLGIIPYSLIYERANKKGNYELWRQDLIAKHFDLTVPVAVATEAISDGRRAQTSEREIDEQGRVKAYNFLIPRIKRLRQFESSEVFQELVAQEEAETSEREQRESSRRLHPASGHKRTLPEGYRASAAARALAEAAGVTLAENETYVKDHNRGDIKNGVVAHYAIRRTLEITENPEV